MKRDYDHLFKLAAPSKFLWQEWVKQDALEEGFAWMSGHLELRALKISVGTS
jgi:hypothetical protein